jgi:hypothetical protein
MRLYIILFSFFFFKTAFAQQNIAVTFNQVFTGNNISVRHSIISHAKHQVSVGLKYHFNRKPKYENGNLFFKAIDAKSTLQHIGLEAEYANNLLLIKQKYNIYVYTNYQYTFAGTNTVLSNRKIVAFDPMNIVENNVGVGLCAKIIKNVYVNIKGGVGYAYLWGIDEQLFFGEKNATWSISRNFSIGLNYKYQCKR